MSIEEIRGLTKEYKYKIELHAHTSPASPCSDMTPKMLIERYAALGFDGIVLTNHFSTYVVKGEDAKTAASAYLKDYYDTKSQGEKVGIAVYLGVEARFADSENDYLLFGIGAEDIEKIFPYLTGDYITFYKEFKNDKNLIIQAHPFRNGMTEQNPEFLDGIEVFNLHPGHNSRIAVASRYANRHPHFIKTCGTDFHHEGHQGLGAVLLKGLPKDSQELAKALKSGDYLLDIAGSIALP